VRQTKIVATLGPASSSEAGIRELIAAGVDVFRLNFSHGSHKSHGEVIARVRAAAAEARRCVALLQDLSGPKIRTGTLQGHTPLPLTAGDTLVIEAGDFEGGPGRVSTTYADLAKSVHRGDFLLLDDGRIQLRVDDTDGHALRTTVVDGGQLGEHKGINAPGVTLPSVGLTAKDAEDLKFGVSQGVDFVALSFVQTAADMRQAREALRHAGAPHIPLIAKLERPEAVEHVEAILHASDAVMIARGDLRGDGSAGYREADGAVVGSGAGVERFERRRQRGRRPHQRRSGCP
jgi:pyruvate kinase